MIFDLEKQTGEVIHPEHSEIRVTIRKLDEVEKMQYISELQKYTKPVVLIHPSTGEILWKDGSPLVYEQQSIPLVTVVEHMKRFIESWTGFTDKNGNPIDYRPEHIKLLFNSRLDFEMPNPDAGKPIIENGIAKVDNDGNTLKQPEKIKTSFWSYINDKAQDDKFFEKDPLELSSAKQ